MSTQISFQSPVPEQMNRMQIQKQVLDRKREQEQLCWTQTSPPKSVQRRVLVLEYYRTGLSMVLVPQSSLKLWMIQTTLQWMVLEATRRTKIPRTVLLLSVHKLLLLPQTNR